MGKKITQDIGHQTAKDIGPEKQETKGSLQLPQPTAWRKVLGYWVGKPGSQSLQGRYQRGKSSEGAQSVLLEYSSEF